MTLEELKAFEAEHPEYKSLFVPILKEFDRIAKEEFGKAFESINARVKALSDEHLTKYNVPKADAKVVKEAINEFVKQVDADMKKKAVDFFEKHKPE